MRISDGRFRVLRVFDQDRRLGKDLPPVIILFGFNEFLGEKILHSLAQGVLQEKNEFNYKRYYFDEEENRWDEIITEARSSSFFFSSRKILAAVIRDEKRLTVPRG